MLKITPCPVQVDSFTRRLGATSSSVKRVALGSESTCSPTVRKSIDPPAPLRGGLAEGCEHVGERGIVALQFQHDAWRACAHVRVRIVEPRNDDAATDVDEPGVGARSLADRDRGADRGDPVAADRDRLGPRRRRVGGKDFAVEQSRSSPSGCASSPMVASDNNGADTSRSFDMVTIPPWTATHKPVPRATPTRSIERMPGVK